jgi:predicted nucleic acid-binding protein
VNGDRFFLDTAYVWARVDRRDQHHRSALAFQNRLRSAAEIWTTEAVLIEIGNALSSTNRDDAFEFIQQCYTTSNIRVVQVTMELLLESLELYRSRGDKQWGLTDCISFIVMQANGLTDALTSDHHFRQAGFRALLLEGP